jgi:prevent-host-death family protein
MRYTERMTRTMTLREANQGFARCIRDVEAGEEIIVTRRGKPVARIVSAATDQQSREREAAASRLRQMMDRGWHLGDEPFDRDSLHER